MAKHSAPLSRPSRDRDSQKAIWEDLYAGRTLATADAMLNMLYDAFTFNPADRCSDTQSRCLNDLCSWLISHDFRFDLLPHEWEEITGIRVFGFEVRPDSAA